MVIPSPSVVLSTATRPSHPANWSTPRHTTHTKWANLHAACPNPQPSTAILALPWPPRCLAIRARPTPHPGPSLPAAPRITPSHLANWSIPFASTHARNSPRAPDACLPGPRRERRPVGRPRPTGAPAQRGRPSCVQTFCGPKVIRGGRPPAHRVLATVSRGQLVNGPLSRTRARTASLP